MTMKIKDLRKLIREAINEMEQDEIIPGISRNDEGSYNIKDSVGKALYDDFVKNSTTIGDLVDALRRKNNASKKKEDKALTDSELLKLAYEIEEKYKPKKSFQSSKKSYKKRY